MRRTKAGVEEAKGIRSRFVVSGPRLRAELLSTVGALPTPEAAAPCSEWRALQGMSKGSAQHNAWGAQQESEQLLGGEEQ
ncbi:MAG TPA: hypothetical protein VM532_13080 [Burkholderiales bacterium]|nr:hypothetical protein [Burkholderiales bacterium]